MVQEFTYSTWTSFWGRFGWMDVYIPNDFYEQARYVTVALLSLTAIAGLLFLVRWVVLRVPVRRPAWQSTLVLAAVLAANVFAYLQFSLQIAFQGQSRYLFPAIVPIAVLFAGGLYVVAPWRVAKVLLFGTFLVWMAYMHMSALTVVVSMG